MGGLGLGGDAVLGLRWGPRGPHTLPPKAAGAREVGSSLACPGGGTFGGGGLGR